MGFSLVATKGTAETLSAAELPVTAVNKVREGRPHIVDRMLSGAVQLVFNTTEGSSSDRRQLQLAAHGADQWDTVLYDSCRRSRGGPGDRRVARREP